MEKTFKILTTTILILIFTACATTKHKFVKSDSLVKDSMYIQKDSTRITTIHKEIKDTLFVSLKTGDKKVDRLITKRFEHFKTAKKSGTNRYAIHYDTKAKGFQITSTIGQTKNVQEQRKDRIVKNNKQVSSKTSQQTKIKYRIPHWIWFVFLIVTGVVYLGAKFKIF